VQYPGGTTTSEIASDLKRLGFDIRRVTSTSVAASTTRADFVDCGTFIQYRDGKKSEFSGAAPLSVIYSDPDNNNFYSREVAVRTRVTVQFAGETATLAERYQVSMVWTYFDGSGSSRQSGTVAPGRPISFSDGTFCGVSGRLVDALG